MERLPLETQTLYAELMEHLVANEAHRAIGHLPGCFTVKRVKDKTYYYYQYSDPGGVVRQVYVGRKSEALDRVVERFHEEREALKPDADRTQRLCAQLRAGGALLTDASSGRVLKALADSGVFYLEGVLLGTQAFSVLGNLLGMRWDHSALRTQDIDINSMAGMSIALPLLKADVPKTLEGLEMGFLPVPPLNPKHPSTSFIVRGNALRLDLLTPKENQGKGDPVFLPRFNVAAQPLRFLDFLMADPVKGAVIDGGGVLVNVPQPARFALHKLIVFEERPVTAHAKGMKDLAQAAQLLKVLMDERPGDVLLVWEELRQRGSGWVKRVENALTTSIDEYREVFEKAAAFLKLR